MDVVILFNGLGNQMSQYAFYLQKKKISSSTRFLFSKKSKNIHNGYELDRVFGIQYHDSLFNKFLYLVYMATGYKKFAFISKPLVRILNILGVALIEESDHYNFNPGYLKPSRGLKFYVGGWHAEKYFVDIEDTVREAFQFRIKDMGGENLDVLKMVTASNSVSVHVRRGDFLDSNNYNKLGAVCTLNYFLVALDKMRSLVSNPHFFFFTNDNSWVKENFNASDFTIVDINARENSWKDMFLISHCSHHINSNGSFSWWSAWLDKNEQSFVIVPHNFLANKHFEDIYPENWIKLSDY